MWNIWTGDRWGQLRLWPAKRSLETENILYEFIYISWELSENQNRKDVQKREMWGHQKFLVVLNYARLHYKLVVQLKSNMKYYPGKSTGQSKSTWGTTKGQFDLDPVRRPEWRIMKKCLSQRCLHVYSYYSNIGQLRKTTCQKALLH